MMDSRYTIAAGRKLRRLDTSRLILRSAYMFGGSSGDDEPESYTVTLEATAEIPIDSADSERDAIQQARSRVSAGDYRIPNSWATQR